MSVSCPWCGFSIDTETKPISEERAERRLTIHKRSCSNRPPGNRKEGGLDSTAEYDY